MCIRDRGHVELLHFKVSENSPLIHLKLFHLHQTLHSNVLVCTVIRGSEVIIPNGDFEFRAGDTVAIASERRDVYKRQEQEITDLTVKRAIKAYVRILKERAES